MGKLTIFDHLCKFLMDGPFIVPSLSTSKRAISPAPLSSIFFKYSSTTKLVFFFEFSKVI